MKSSGLCRRAVSAVLLLGLLEGDHALAESCATPSFAAPRTFSVGTKPVAVAVSDFNGDGRPDLAVACQESLDGSRDGDVWVLLNTGEGSFRLGGTYSVGNQPRSIVAGDLNGDGRPDLVAVNEFSTNVSILLGKGDGTFQPATHYTVGYRPLSLVLGDFDHDGKLDLAVGNYGTVGISVLRGNGDGTFQTAVTYDETTAATSLAVGDFNGDGESDLAMARAAGVVSGLLAGER